MLLVALTVLGGIAVGWAQGGRIRNLATTNLRSTWLIVLAVVAQTLTAVVRMSDPQALTLLLASQLAVLLFAARNWLLPGTLLVGAGALANGLVIALNGAMPVAEEAMLRIGRHPLEIMSAKHRLMEPGDALPWLADVIALPLLAQVVSVGDVLLAAGIGVLVAGLMRRHPPLPGRRSRRLPRQTEPVDGGGKPIA